MALGVLIFVTSGGCVRVVVVVFFYVCLLIVVVCVGWCCVYSVVCVLYLLWVECVSCVDGLFECVGTTFVCGCDAVVLCMTY